MPEPIVIALVAAGGALGAGGRYWLSGVVAHRFGELFPWGTMAVNVSGALLLGVLAGAWPAPAPSALWSFLAVGVLGSYTTVSSFSLQTLALLRDGATSRAILNIALSLAACLAAAAGGYVGAAALLGG